MTTAVYKDFKLPKPHDLPSTYYEVYLPLPYGKGFYRFLFLKTKRPKKGSDSVEVTALTRLVRVTSIYTNRNHFQAITVKPYKKRIKTWHYEKAKLCQS